MTAASFPAKPRLHWSRVDTMDDRATRDLKLILSEREFRVLSGSQAVRPSFYRGRDEAGHAIMVQVVADDLAA